MASVAKIIEKMKNQPNNIRFEEAEKVLNKHGYAVSTKKGSHRTFRSSGGKHLCIPYKTPAIDKYYVGEILKRIED